MKLLTNFVKGAEKDMIEYIRISGVDAEIRHEAYDWLRQDMPGYYSVWYNNEKKQDKEIEMFFICSNKMQSMLKSIYISNGVPEELVEKEYLYRGCEKDYFPEYTIDYTKMKKD